MPRIAKKGDFFARIFDISLYIIISGDTNDHRGMRVEEEREEGGGGGEEEEEKDGKMESQTERSQDDHEIRTQKGRVGRVFATEYIFE